MSTPIKYKAFISYSHSDEKFVRYLHRRLETYKIPVKLVGTPTGQGIIPNRLRPIFRDRDELSSSAELGGVLQAALESSENLIVVCSNNAANSRWVNEEIRQFKMLGREKNIFSIIPDTQITGTPVFPENMLAKFDTQGNHIERTIEPVAADARQNGDGKSNAILKLIAGMLGISFDTLKQRDHARQQKRLAMITGGALSTSLAFGLIAAFAFSQKNEADLQRRSAEVKAETASRTADFLKSLFQVSDPQKSQGNSISARELLDQGAARIRIELNDQPEVKADLLVTMGDVYTGLGLYPQSESLLIESQKFRTSSAQSAKNLVESNLKLARVYYFSSKYPEAGKILRDQLTTRTLEESNNLEMRTDALTQLAETLIAQEKFPAAKGILLDLVTKHDMNIVNNSEQLISILTQLGFIASTQKDFKSARQHLLRALAVRRQVSEKDHPNIGVLFNELGYLEYDAKNPETAESYFEQALPISEKTLGLEHPEYSSMLNNLARLKLMNQKYAQANSMFTTALAIDRKMLGMDHDMVVYTLNSLGMAKMALGELTKARSLFDEARPIATKKLPDMLGAVLINQADVRCRQGKFIEGTKIAQLGKTNVLQNHKDDAWYGAWADSVLGYCQTGNAPFTADMRRRQTNNLVVLKARWGNNNYYVADVRNRLKS